METTSILNRIKGKYVDQYLESAKKINYTELTEKDGLVTVLYKDLPETEIHGYPVASDFISPDGTVYSVGEFDKLPKKEQILCELRYHYLPYVHELYVGTTGREKRPDA